MTVMTFEPGISPFEMDADNLRSNFGERLQTNIPLARYTSARTGGTADAIVVVETVAELAETVERLWQMKYPFVILGGGSNVLVSDAGVRSLVLLNRAREIRIEADNSPPTVWAGSGTNFGLLARQVATHGLAGLEWAAGIPGTVGGAVFGNAGAHGGDVAGCLLVAEILHHEKGRVIWPLEEFSFAYRSSILKREAQEAIILSATFALEKSDPQIVRTKMDEFNAYRRKSQPPGASMGSMFKNPPGDYAGRLIEQVGLKGYRLGEVQISDLHANFFVNLGHARASDIYNLIHLAQVTVAEKFGVNLELEIELVGDWEAQHD